MFRPSPASNANTPFIDTAVQTQSGAQKNKKMNWIAERERQYV
jgi:hypothetical protein